MTELNEPTRQQPQREEDTQTAEGEVKKGTVDEAIDKARELGLINKANEMVEKAKNRLSGNR